MAIPTLPKWAIAGLAFPLIVLNSWILLRLGALLQPITSVVITACLLAFLLDYPIKLLEKRKVSRGGAIALVLLSALVSTAILLIFLGPLVWQQLNEFAERLPGWIDQATQELLMLGDRPFVKNSPFDFEVLAVEATNRLSNFLKTATSQAINLILGAINSTLNLLITLVLSILLVINGEKLWNGLLGWLPDKLQAEIRESLQPSFRGYFSGQATLALILSIALSTAFTLLGIPLGLLFGITIGLFSVVPFGGLLAILGVSTLLAFESIWLGVKVLAVSVILGQINDNVIAPRLIGGATGLNPAIVIVSLLIGAKFAGFLGLILAVPTASFIKKVADALREPITQL
ncbi:AI-2E family transporter [Vacuolonema iberomarrocanum]|uniref:AI-2E family transporter n=1 Tax=Vacuolonema iberomarrocanum TaxID=3454632 RepID=UPI0019F087D2|nr:AI-2E family transporter [filamentous cyanobacterium LEGE 07170]